MTPPTRRQLSSISVLIARQSFLALCPNDLITDLSWRPVRTGVIYTRQLITKLGIDCNFLPHVLGQGHQLHQPREMSLSGRPHVTILPSLARINAADCRSVKTLPRDEFLMTRASAGHRALIDVLLGLQNSAPLRDRLERSWPWSATTISDRRRRSWWTAGVYPSRLNANSRILCMKLDWLAAARHESTAFPLWWGAIKVLVTRPLKLSEWVFINNWSSFAFERESEVSKGAISTRGFFSEIIILIFERDGSANLEGNKDRRLNAIVLRSAKTGGGTWWITMISLLDLPWSRAQVVEI